MERLVREELRCNNGKINRRRSEINRKKRKRKTTCTHKASLLPLERRELRGKRKTTVVIDCGERKDKERSGIGQKRRRKEESLSHMTTASQKKKVNKKRKKKPSHLFT